MARQVAKHIWAGTGNYGRACGAQVMLAERGERPGLLCRHSLHPVELPFTALPAPLLERCCSCRAKMDAGALP